MITSPELVEDQRFIATLDQVEDQGFYFSGETEKEVEAIEQIKADPTIARVTGTWGLRAGEHLVPMLQLHVGEDVVLNLDKRNPLGSKIYERHIGN